MNRNLLWAIFLSFVPVSELRGGIPFAYFNGTPLLTSAIICILANMLVPLVCWAFLSTLNGFFTKHWEWYRRVVAAEMDHARKKLSPAVEKFGFWGVMLFVAIPLPFTGAWTGAVGSWVLGLEKKKAFGAIMLGVVIAGIIVSAVIAGGSSLASIFTKKF